MNPAARLALCAAVAGSCAAPRPGVSVGAPEPRLLTEAQALAAIQESLVQGGTLARRSLPAMFQGGTGAQAALDADVYFGTPPFAIEWVTDEDRARHGALLPAGSPTSPLQIVTADVLNGKVQVLVLDDRVYSYEGNPLRVQRGAPRIDEAERRVRRDVADFLSYVRDQGAAL